MTESSVGNVLVVDDTLDNLRLFSDLLGEQGYDVRAVTNGRQALVAAGQDPPDLILLDINMPDMNGYEVCRLLRAQDRTKDVPVIFLTALTDTADKVRAFDAGGVDYVTKPFRVEEVLARVRTHVALRRAQTELAGTYSRLRALEQLREDLVRMVVHDMRSPLVALFINLRLLEEQAVGLGADQRELLQASVESAEAVSRMANDLLDVSRLEECRMPIDLEVWNLARMAHDVRAALGVLDAARQIDIDSPATVEATCDGALVRRVIENLVSNGIRHTPAGSRICISVAGRAGAVRVEVQDEGRGVPPDVRQTIFEKFGAVAARRESTYHSAGLGLAFCKLAIEAHGGRIGVDARVPTGSVFWFELPA